MGKLRYMKKMEYDPSCLLPYASCESCSPPLVRWGVSGEGNDVSNEWSAYELRLDGDGWSPMQVVFFSLLLWVGCFCYFACECCFVCVCVRVVVFFCFFFGGGTIFFKYSCLCTWSEGSINYLVVLCARSLQLCHGVSLKCVHYRVHTCNTGAHLFSI